MLIYNKTFRDKSTRGFIRRQEGRAGTVRHNKLPSGDRANTEAHHESSGEDVRDERLRKWEQIALEESRKMVRERKSETRLLWP